MKVRGWVTELFSCCWGKKRSVSFLLKNSGFACFKAHFNRLVYFFWTWVREDPLPRYWDIHVLLCREEEMTILCKCSLISQVLELSSNPSSSTFEVWSGDIQVWQPLPPHMASKWDGVLVSTSTVTPTSLKARSPLFSKLRPPPPHSISKPVHAPVSSADPQIWWYFPSFSQGRDTLGSCMQGEGFAGLYIQQPGYVHWR